MFLLNVYAALPSFWLIIFTHFMYYFPIAVVKDYCKLRGLTQHRYIILQFWHSEIQSESYRTKIKSLPWLCSYGGTSGSSPFPVSKGVLHVLTHDLFLCLQNASLQLLFILTAPFSDSDSPPSSL